MDDLIYWFRVYTAAEMFGKCLRKESSLLQMAKVLGVQLLSNSYTCMLFILMASSNKCRQFDVHFVSDWSPPVDYLSTWSYSISIWCSDVYIPNLIFTNNSIYLHPVQSSHYTIIAAASM